MVSKYVNKLSWLENSNPVSFVELIDAIIALQYTYTTYNKPTKHYKHFSVQDVLNMC